MLETLLQLTKNGLVIGLLYALFAYGLSIIISTTGVWHFAHGLVFVLGGHIFWSMFEVRDLAIWIAAPLTLIFAALLGLVMEFALYRPLRRLGASPMVVLVASLSLLSLGENLAPLIWGSDLKSIHPRPIMGFRFFVGPVSVTFWDLMVIAASIVSFVVLYWFMNKTRLGLAFQAMGDNPERAESLGISLNKTFMWVFIVGSIVAVPATILLAIRNPLQQGTGFEVLVKSVIALIVGGIGSMNGALAGGVLIGLLENLAAWRIPTEWAQFILFGVLFIFIVVRPHGMFPRSVRRA